MSGGGPATTVVTLALDVASQARFEAERRAWFPPARNRVPAHLTLFHALPAEPVVAATLAAEAVAFALPVTGLRFLGAGVAYTLAAPELTALHGRLARAFAPWLIPQDRQPFRPHVVVQNKADPAAARALLAQLEAGFAPWTVQAVGLDWWDYLGGPWAHRARFCP